MNCFRCIMVAYVVVVKCRRAYVFLDFLNLLLTNSVPRENNLSRTGCQVLAPVVQKVDSAIHLINHYPVDKD